MPDSMMEAGMSGSALVFVFSMIPALCRDIVRRFGGGG
jgi:hypothetical protein